MKKKEKAKPRFKRGDFITIDEGFFEKYKGKIQWDNWQQVIGCHLDDIIGVPFQVEKILDFSDFAEFKGLNRINYVVNRNGKEIQLHDLWVRSYEFIDDLDFEIE